LPKVFMRTEDAPLIRLEDYRPSDWLIDTVDLDISLDATKTRVRSLLALRPNPAGQAGAALRLDGDELALASLKLDGVALAANAYEASAQALVIHAPPRRGFTLTIETVLDPSANTKLMGLYRSSNVYCTQCEADGFRRITYFLDRPDVMSRLYGAARGREGRGAGAAVQRQPRRGGDVPGGDRHFAVWHDPHPKPAYLFALVGGALDHVIVRITSPADGSRSSSPSMSSPARLTGPAGRWIR
jgi:aminopeptidase N